MVPYAYRWIIILLLCLSTELYCLENYWHYLFVVVISPMQMHLHSLENHRPFLFRNLVLRVAFPHHVIICIYILQYHSRSLSYWFHFK
jgi:hypothetical protein